MSANKQIVETYMEGFRQSDHAKILTCLTDDIEWEMPGAFSVKGKREFEGDTTVGVPIITILRMVEQDNVVVAEGAVSADMRDGGQLSAVFCDVFDMELGKIKRLTSYVVELK